MRSPLTAFILAGGRSSRMGQEKAALDLGGKSLLEIMRAKAAAVAAQVALLGPRERFGVEAIEDIFSGHGPLAGIHAALRYSKTELNLMLAIDLPFVAPEFLRHLAREADLSQALVVVPRTADGWQPLCAIYRRAFADVAERALAEGRNKIDALFDPVRLRIVDEEEMRALGFDANMFQNLNTPEDLAAARTRLARQRNP